MYLIICIYFKVAWHSLVTFDALESLLTDLDILFMDYRFFIFMIPVYGQFLEHHHK